MFVRWVALVAALASASCASSERTSAPVETLRDGCAAYAAVLSDVARACFGGELAGTAVRREASARAECLSAIALDDSSVTKEMFAACAIAVRDAPCGHWPSCEAPPGRRADGDRCVSSLQCQSRLCRDIGATGCGVCTPRVPVGGSCLGGDCVDGAQCNARTCVAVPPSAVGGPCTAGGPGPFCDEGLLCHSTTATCKAPAKVGESCAIVPCAGIWAQCDAMTSVCFVPGLAREGEPCGAELGVVCDQGLSCPGRRSTCVALQPLEPGAACGAGVCAWGECTSGRCPVVIADRAPCAADGSLGVCGPGASCINGTCLQPHQIVCR
jgi:hypothetical protein